MNGKTMILVVAVLLVLGLATTATAQSTQDCSADGTTCLHEQNVNGTVAVSLAVVFDLIDFGFGPLIVGDNVKANVGTIDIQSNTSWTLGVRGGNLSVQRHVDTNGDGTREWTRVCDDGSTFDAFGQVGCGTSTRIPTTLDRLSVTHAAGTVDSATVTLQGTTNSTLLTGTGSQLVDTLDIHLELQADDRATAPLADRDDDGDGVVDTVRWRAGREAVQGDGTDRSLPVMWNVAAS